MNRGLSSEEAKRIRQEGHNNAKIFALAIGMSDNYQNDAKAKKDVIDPSGDAHSLKSGNKKWQIFLYGRKRFIEDDGFQALNGVGGLLTHCIDAFPPSYEDYIKDKDASKKRLEVPMRELKDRFQRKALLRAFLAKSIFNGGEVDYLTILDNDCYHVFYSKDVIQCLGKHVTVHNSEMRSAGQYANQKVLFKYGDYNLAELEMRNDSATHYQEVRFNMIKPKMMELLYSQITKKEQFSDIVNVYGDAIKRFGNWAK